MADIKINQQELSYDGRSYELDEIIRSLSNTTYQVIVDIFLKHDVKIPRKVRMDAMRATLRPSIVKTRSECLTLDQKLNYRLLWFNTFSEEQMSFYFEYFKSKELNRVFATKFYRNLLLWLNSEKATYSKVLEELIPITIENKDILDKEIKIKDILKSFDPFFVDNKNVIDGLLIDKFRPVIYNSATKEQVERIGQKYGISIPNKINKSTIGAYVIEKLKAMGVDTTELMKNISTMAVKDIRQFAKDNGLETSGELNKKEMIEYILQRAYSTRNGYTCPENDRVYEMSIPISDEETIYERIIVEQAKIQEELLKNQKDLSKKHGEELEKAKMEQLELEKESKAKQIELEKMEEQFEIELERVPFEKVEFEEVSKTPIKPEVSFEDVVKNISKESSKKQSSKKEKEEESGAVESEIASFDDDDIEKTKIKEEYVSDIANYGDYDSNLDDELDKENAQKDLILYEPQKQDLMLYAELEKTKTNRRSLITLIVLIISAIIAVVIGIILYKGLTTYTELEKNSFDLKPKSEEALEPVNNNLTVSPYNFKGNLDLRDYYDSASTLSFTYYKKKDEKGKKLEKLENIDLAKIYEKRANLDNYLVYIQFKTIRKYIYAGLNFDFKNVINLKTPKGDSLVSWKDYQKYPGAHTGFFEEVLRNNNLFDQFSGENDPLKKDAKDWFFDEERSKSFDKKELLKIKNDKKIKEIVLYSNNKFTEGITVRYRFLFSNDIQNTLFAKQNEVIEDQEYLDKLEKALIYPTMKIDNTTNKFNDEDRDKAKNYYFFDGWFYKQDYPESGISRGDKFDITKTVPNRPFASYDLIPRFRRRAMDIYYMSYEDIFKNEKDYNLDGKEKTIAQVSKNSLGMYEWVYELENYKSEHEDKYFINWINKDHDVVKNNMQFDIAKHDFENHRVYLYPRYKKYIKVDFSLLNLEDLKLDSIKGKDDETIESKMDEINKNIAKIEEIDNYHTNENTLEGLFLTDGRKLDDTITFADLEKLANKIEIRYKKVPVTVTFKRFFYDNDKDALSSENSDEITKFYYKNTTTYKEILDEQIGIMKAKYPDYIYEKRTPDFDTIKLSDKKISLNINFRPYKIKLQISGIKINGQWTQTTIDVYKDQKLTLNYDSIGNEEIYNYEYSLHNPITGKYDRYNFFKGDNLNSIITYENDSKKFLANPQTRKRKIGVVEITKIFIDESKPEGSPLRMRKYTFPEKIKNLPLGENIDSLKQYQDIRDNEISDPERFEIRKTIGNYPDYLNPETKIIYYYTLADVSLSFDSEYNPSFESFYFSGDVLIERTIRQSEFFAKLKEKIDNYNNSHSYKIKKWIVKKYVFDKEELTTDELYDLYMKPSFAGLGGTYNNKNIRFIPVIGY